MGIIPLVAELKALWRPRELEVDRFLAQERLDGLEQIDALWIGRRIEVFGTQAQDRLEGGLFRRGCGVFGGEGRGLGVL